MIDKRQLNEIINLINEKSKNWLLKIIIYFWLFKIDSKKFKGYETVV